MTRLITLSVCLISLVVGCSIAPPEGVDPRIGQLKISDKLLDSAQQVEVTLRSEMSKSPFLGSTKNSAGHVTFNGQRVEYRRSVKEQSKGSSTGIGSNSSSVKEVARLENIEFTLNPTSATPTPVNVRCQMQRTSRSETEESEIKIGKRRFKSKDTSTEDLNPFNLECEFSSGGDSGAQPVSKLTLFEAGKDQQVIVRERQGNLRFAGRQLQIRSIHELRGIRLLSGTPFGYLFEEGDAQVAAIAIKRKTIYLPDANDIALRQALLQLVLALELLSEDK
jgi:hypothetical protein